MEFVFLNVKNVAKRQGKNIIGRVNGIMTVRKKVFVLSEKNEIGHNASGKARQDIATILHAYFTSVGEMPKIYGGTMKKIIANAKLYRRLKQEKVAKGDVLLIQFPLPKGYNRILPFLNRRFKCIYLIHDLEGLRYFDSRRIKQDIRCLKKGYIIISHNKYMTRYLMDEGINKCRIVELKMFDYLLDNNISISDHFKDKEIMCFAGNLEKAEFLGNVSSFLLDERINVYGLPENIKFEPNIFYRGSYDADTIPYKLCGKFGLVWDGTASDTCSGLYGHYMKYNNPHKLSLYISAGMPVIVWDKSAVAELVNSEKIGIVVGSVKDAVEQIKRLDEEHYRVLQNNVMCLRDRVISGRMIIDVLEKIMETNLYDFSHCSDV